MCTPHRLLLPTKMMLGPSQNSEGGESWPLRALARVCQLPTWHTKVPGTAGSSRGALEQPALSQNHQHQAGHSHGGEKAAEGDKALLCWGRLRGVRIPTLGAPPRPAARHVLRGGHRGGCVQAGRSVRTLGAGSYIQHLEAAASPVARSLLALASAI